MTTPTPPAGWYADQSNPRLLRWWDGNMWTQHTQPNAQQAAPPQPHAPAPQQPQAQPDAQPQRDTLSEALGVAPMNNTPGGTLYTAPVLIVNQKDHLVQVSAGYNLLDDKGTKLGSIAQVDKNKFMKAFRVMTDMGKEMTQHYEVRDAEGNAVLRIEAPNKFIGARFAVNRPDGSPVGVITSGKMFSGPMLSLVANGSQVGSIRFGKFASKMREMGPGAAFEQIKRDLRSGEALKRHPVVDEAENEVAAIEKRAFHDLGLREGLTTSDSYLVERPRPLSEPLASLVLAAPLALDLYLYDDERAGK